MAFEKTNKKIGQIIEIEALNTPRWPEFNLTKFASRDISGLINGFDIKKAITENPEHLFVKIFAIKADKVNDNGDAFTQDELKRSASTFIGVPVFCNHQNDDIEKARGKCVHAWYDDEKKGVYIISMVDRVAYPRLVRGIEEGYVTGTSMGAMSGDAEILMADFSQKKISDIAVGDSVISHLGNSCKVKEVHSDYLGSELIKFDLGNIANSPLFTFDHPVLSIRKTEVLEQRKNKDWREFPYDCIFREAKDLSLGDFLLVPSRYKLSENSEFDTDFYYLLGVFAGDGYIKFNRGNIEGFGFCFGSGEFALIEKVKEILAKFTEYKINENVIESRNGCYITIYDKKLAKQIDRIMGHGAHSKRIKLESFSREAIESFISGYIDTDGCMVKDYSNCKNTIRGFQISSCNRELLEDVRSMLILLDCAAGVKTNVRKSSINSCVNVDTIEHTLFISLFTSSRMKQSIKVAKNLKGYEASYYNTPNFIFNIGKQKYIACRIKGIDLIDDFKEEVYDLTVENDESYIANGLAVHNCSVEFSICSICHNKAHVAEDFCDHIKNGKNRKISGKVKCAYHDSPSKPEDDCPICGKKKEEKKEFEHKDAKVYEYNYGVKFIEDSFVVNPACSTCLVEDVFNISELTKKVAYLKERMKKVSAKDESGKLEKVAGQAEVALLTDAMTYVEKVSKSMMSQKEHISMAYVAELVDVMASLQETLDELIEMGYVKLPSPDLNSLDNVVLPKTGKDAEKLGYQPQPSPIVEQPVKQMPTINNTVNTPGAVSEPLGDLGTVTHPKYSFDENEKITGIKKDFVQACSNLKVKLTKLGEILDSMDNNKDKESMIMDNKKNSETQEKQSKVAGATDVTTEKQLDDVDAPKGGRSGAPDVITEKQLDDPKDVNVTTSESPQERRGSYDVITEKQLQSISGTDLARWGDYPEVITEKQWQDTNRLIGSELSKDQSEIVTEKQLEDFLSKHRYADLDVITEKQLNSGNTTQTKRASYQYDPQGLVKSAVNAIADTIAFYQKTPNEVTKAAMFINENVKNIDKAALLLLVNALGNKKEAKINEKNRMRYFSKLASVKSPDTVDALIANMSDYLESHSAEDFIYAVKHVASNNKAMIKVNNLVKEKLASTEDVSSSVVDKVSQLDSALNDIDKPEDGMYQVQATIDEIKVNPTNKKAFLKAVIKMANAEIAKEMEQNIPAALVKVDIDEKAGVVVATLKAIEKLDKEEKKAYAKLNHWLVKTAKKEEADPEVSMGEDTDDGEKDAIVVASRKEKREKLIKEAQMFGGEMGGQGGTSQAPGAGATLPQPPAAGGVGAMAPAAPVESFEQSDFGGDMEDDDMDIAEPTPPGTRCPACGSIDVDTRDGKSRCNNCGTDFYTKVEVVVSRWAGTMEGESEDNKIEDTDSADVTPGLAGEGFELPESGEVPMAAAASTSNNKQIKFARVAATTKIKDSVLKHLKANNIQLGSVSPLTGTQNTVKLSNGNYKCLDTGSDYHVAYSVDSKNPKNIYAEWKWMPVVNYECPDCSRAKRAFVDGLAKIDMTEDKFDALDLSEKGKVILAMKNKGMLGRIKTASTKSGSTIAQYKQAYGEIANDFPIESCIEKLARRYGEDAIALSGPCEGKNLAECVCKSLKQAKIYSHNLAIKVADIWCDPDAGSECIEDYVREGFNIKQATTVCSMLKAKYAQFDDMIAEDLGNEIGDTGGDDDDGDVEVDTFTSDDIDPFDDAEGGATITLNLPSEVLEQLDEAIDIAKGENPDLEEHHQDVPEGDIEIEVPADIVEEIDEIADDALGTAAEGENVIEDIIGEDNDDSAEDDNEVSVEIEEVEVVDENNEDFSENNEGIDNDDIEDNMNDSDSPADDGEQYKEGEDMDLEDIEKEAQSMKKGYIGKVGEISLDLSRLKDILNKQASEKKVDYQNVQDSPDIGKIKNNGTMGKEDKFDAKAPNLPQGKNTLGKEKNIKEETLTIPAGSSPMGHESEQGLDGGDTRATGGEDGAGKSSTASRIKDLANRIVEAKEKKLKAKEPVAKDKDIQPIQNGKTIGDEEKFDAKEVDESKMKTKDGFMGKEKETLKNKPDSPKDHPSIPAGEGKMKNDVNDPEKQDNIKGTVVAGSNEESVIEKEAFRIAGRMVAVGSIKPEDLATKVAELKQYKVAQLKDLEKGIFASKGLNAVSDGLEQPVLISENSNQRNGQQELAHKLASLFRLTKQNDLAQQTDIDFRKNF
ncbi:MAG: LAGLIDADG family homing endonuclease [Phenylobacterium sp.]